MPRPGRGARKVGRRHRPAAVVGRGRDGDADTEAEEGDPAEFLEHAPDAGADHESAAEARLLEAFPGASEVAG